MSSPLDTLIASAKVLTAAQQVVTPDKYGLCWLCTHNVNVCDCGISELRLAVCKYLGIEVPSELPSPDQVKP